MQHKIFGILLCNSFPEVVLERGDVLGFYMGSSNSEMGDHRVLLSMHNLWFSAKFSFTINLETFEMPRAISGA